MKKTFFILLIIGLGLIMSSCTRTDITDPAWDGPAGFYVLLEGSADPALLLIDGNSHSSNVHVRVTDSKGNPLEGETIFIEQLADSTSSQQINWGYFENHLMTISKVTNVRGEVSVNFFAPLKWPASSMYIHALMVVNDRSYSGTVPQDYIALTMVKSTPAKGPVVIITSPPDGAVVSGTVAITAMATADSGINAVECLIDNKLIDSKAASTTSNSYSFSWNAAQYHNGVHDIDVHAYDKNGVFTEDSVHVTLNNSDAPPTAAIIYPNDGANIILPAGNAITVQANATDNIGVSRVSFFVNGSLVQQNMSKSGNLYEYNWIPPADGAYTLYVIAYDTINQATKSAEVKVTINVNNGAIPVVNITAPAPNATVSGTVAITALATADSGIDKVECSIDNQLIDSKPGSTTSDSYSFSWNATQYANGIHTIKVTAYDKKGVSNSASINVTVNNAPTDSPPVVTLIYPLDKTDIAPGSIKVLANAEDDKGIDYVELYVNDVLIGRTDFNGARIANFTKDYTITSSETKFYVIAWDTIGQKTVSNIATVNQP